MLTIEILACARDGAPPPPRPRGPGGHDAARDAPRAPRDPRPPTDPAGRAKPSAPVSLNNVRLWRDGAPRSPRRPPTSAAPVPHLIRAKLERNTAAQLDLTHAMVHAFTRLHIVSMHHPSVITYPRNAAVTTRPPQPALSAGAGGHSPRCDASQPPRTQGSLACSQARHLAPHCPGSFGILKLPITPSN